MCFLKDNERHADSPPHQEHRPDNVASLQISKYSQLSKSVGNQTYLVEDQHLRAIPRAPIWNGLPTT